MTDTQDLIQRIAEAKEHALLYGGLNTAFWPYQRFAMTVGELFDALETAQAEIEVQTKAADHWMSEANKSHNLTITQQAEIERHKLHIKHIGNDALRTENAELRARLAELEKRNQLNQSTRSTVDDLLAQAGYAEDSSARNLLGCMNFDAAAGASPEPSALQEENAKLITALAECRDAFPVPDAGSRLDDWYCTAMADPLEVPEYVKACLAAQPTKTPPYLQERLQDFTCEKVENAGGTPGYTIYKTSLGRSGPFSLYDGEALALWANIGKALGPEYTSTSPVQPSQAGELSDAEAKELWLYENGKRGYNTHELPARFLRAAIAAINAKEAK